MFQTPRHVSSEEREVVVAGGEITHRPAVRRVELDLEVPGQLTCRLLLPARPVLGLDAVEFN